MPFDFQDSRYISKNGRQSPIHRERIVSDGIKRGSFFNFKASPKRMEKLFLAVLTWIGLGSYIAGILLNIGNWKSLILFALGVAFMFAKLVRYVIKTYHEYKREEIELQILKKKSKE